MAQQLDIEAVCASVEAFLKLNFNTKIAAIDTEKGDGITLAQVNESAYFFEYLGSKVANFNPFIYYGIEDMSGASRFGAGLAQRLRLSVAVVLEDSGNDTQIVARLLRYQRALSELFTQNWDSIGGANKLGARLKWEVTGEPPYALDAAVMGKKSRIIGVSIETVMG